MFYFHEISNYFVIIGTAIFSNLPLVSLATSYHISYIVFRNIVFFLAHSIVLLVCYNSKIIQSQFVRFENVFHRLPLIYTYVCFIIDLFISNLPFPPIH